MARNGKREEPFGADALRTCETVELPSSEVGPGFYRPQILMSPAGVCIVLWSRFLMIKSEVIPSAGVLLAPLFRWR